MSAIAPDNNQNKETDAVEVARNSVANQRIEIPGRNMQLLSTALEATSNAVIITDREGSIEWINAAFTHLTGYSFEEVCGKKTSFLKSGAHDAAFYKDLWRAISAGNVWRAEMINRRKDGSLYTEDNTITPVRDEQDRITHFIAVKQDITEAKRLRDELRSTNATLTQVLNHAAAVIFTVAINGAKGTPIYVSESIQRLLGASFTDAMTYDWWLENIHPADHERVLATTAEGRNIGAYMLEYRLRHKDGTYRWVEETTRVIYDAAGQPKELAGLWTDITKRKTAEEALRTSELELSRARHLAKYGNWTWDITRDLLTWSEEIGRMFAIGDTHSVPNYDAFVAMVDPADRPAVIETNRKARADGMPFEITYTINTPQNEKRVIREMGYGVADETGKMTRLIGTAQDITAQKNADAELRQKTTLLEAQINSSLDGILVVNKDGVPILQNQRLFQLWKVSPEVIATPAARVLLHATMARVKNPHDYIDKVEYLYAHPNEVSRDELELEDGTILDRYSSPVVGKDGQLYGRIWAFRDVTRQKKLEADLHQSQKLEGIGQLAGGVAHDFNNLLAVMRGNAELLLMDKHAASGAIREGLAAIIDASEQAAGLTRQLLMFSRKQTMQTQVLDLNELIRNIVRMLKRVIREDIQLGCNYEVAPSFVRADASMMEQVLLNVVVNARDAMPHGGSVRVSTETVILDNTNLQNPQARAGAFVCMSVTDTGDGIAPEHLPRIFEPFFTTKPVGKGTGLGLATVYGIVKQHLGWVEVESQFGKGATFKVFLPASEAPAAPTAPGRAQLEFCRGTETILVVEDDNEVRMITRRMLETYGYKVYDANCARQALDIWTRHAGHFALLVSDIIMPGEINGRRLAEQLWTLNPKLPVIFMSGYSMDVLGKDNEFLHRTRSRLLQKPCTTSALVQTVRQCLDGIPEA